MTSEAKGPTLATREGATVVSGSRTTLFYGDAAPTPLPAGWTREMMDAVESGRITMRRAKALAEQRQSKGDE